MSTEISIPDCVYSVEKDFNQINSYKMNFMKEAQFALQILMGSNGLQEAAKKNPASLEYAIINLAAIGISLNPALKEAYLVPRGGKVCLDISYIGLVKLATDAGAIKWVQAQIVKEKDDFKFLAVGKAPVHEMKPFGDRGKTIGVYCVAKTADGESLTTMMSYDEVMDIKKKASQSGNVWQNWEEEMIKKTCIKRASKLWPKSERLQKAVGVLDEHEGIDFNLSRGPTTVDQAAMNAPEPTVDDCATIKERLVKAGKSEAGLISLLSKQFNMADILSVDQFDNAMIDYAYRYLGGRP
jgi:recombination protein RecT